jgi:signal peptidase I
MAERKENRGRRNVMHRAPLYMFFGFVTAIVCLLVIGALLTLRYEMPTAAMEPSLRQGDRLAEIRFFGLFSTRRGQVAAFYLPFGPRLVTIRRVVGLAGDRIRVLRGTLVLNGKQVYEPYVRVSSRSAGLDFPSVSEVFSTNDEMRPLQDQMYAEWVKDGSLVVPQGYCFLLGDNRNHSIDSRNFGPVPLSNIFAWPYYVYSSKFTGSMPRLIDSYRIGMPP